SLSVRRADCIFVCTEFNQIDRAECHDDRCICYFVHLIDFEMEYFGTLVPDFWGVILFDSPGARSVNQQTLCLAAVEIFIEPPAAVVEEACLKSLQKVDPFDLAPACHIDAGIEAGKVRVHLLDILPG